MSSQTFKKLFIGIACLVLMLAGVTKVSADGADCFCATDLSKIKPANLAAKKDKILAGACYTAEEPSKKHKAGDCYINSKILTPEQQKNINVECWRATPATPAACDALKVKWADEFKKKSDTAATAGSSSGGGAAKEKPSAPSTLSSLIAECGKAGKISEWQSCADITVLVSLMLDLVDYLFGIIGALALGAFVYGGFMLIISQGNPEKVKQGTGAMINAVIGLVVAFGGYMLVSFAGELLHLDAAYKLLQ